jgi:hypothetical protein
MSLDLMVDGDRWRAHLGETDNRHTTRSDLRVDSAVGRKRK